MWPVANHSSFSAAAAAAASFPCSGAPEADKAIIGQLSQPGMSKAQGGPKTPEERVSGAGGGAGGGGECYCLLQCMVGPRV